MSGEGDEKVAKRFIAGREEFWKRDGLGHWAFIFNRQYVGWSGFQLERNEWVFGLLLKPDVFGLGMRIATKYRFLLLTCALHSWHFICQRFEKIWVSLIEFGAKHVGRVEYEGAEFLKYQLKTE